MRLFPAVALIAVAIASPAAAKTLTFNATLTGIAPPTTTGSPARGKAVIKVDMATKKVSVDLDVTGITLDQLNDGLVAKPIGPIHFHVYRTADDVELILPLPYGPNYKATPKGFHVTVRGYDYEAGAKLLNTGATFDEFVNGMRSQRVVLNIHTDKFPDGEISGKTMVK
ncbi:CHRD domain-containing protein [Sphingomonas panacisoli]|uniref:CHRD domain-containing protein n=1 Tax=Sphingomonas panacisoli TaxID=1813879 RepID=A0A5B8LEU6_9SPHN|nr:CHRD domain-containing protein [Sphingomonas panacisoli]QDZ06697.1 CHRD domain-containing protein [Sphingomonas panacisoli]